MAGYEITTWLCIALVPIGNLTGTKSVTMISVERETSVIWKPSLIGTVAIR